MLPESIASICASVYSWFTPTVLFLLLNLMIATITLTSGIGTENHHHNDKQHTQHPQPLARSPSVLQRLKSINLCRYRSEEETPFPSITTTYQPSETESVQKLETAQQQEQREKEEVVYQIPDQVRDDHVTRTTSDTRLGSGDMTVKLPRKMKKSASAKSAFGHFEEEEEEEEEDLIVDRRRPSTVRENKSRGSDMETFGMDEEVDAKADDFINRFKQQLKLQRLDSL
uniref:DUF4408 domain-containing protein n=1 Tax=Nelumbo nucifera TaxID=4432 RepID=A0A822ZSV6_NELNU|nr:TPA_asm: hypothetical protein HUJ06_018931 [Nelumbo nucifera]